MTRRRPLLQGALLAPCLAHAAPAATLKAVAGDGTVPFNYLLDGRLQGLSVDLAEELARRAGLRLELEALPFRLAYERGLHQPDVLLFTLARTPPREALFEWLGPIAPRDVWLWKMKRRTDIQIRKLAEARQYRVGVAYADAIIPKLEQLGFAPRRNLEVVHDRRALGRMLRMGRFDLIPMVIWSEGKLDAEPGMAEEALEPVLQLTTEGGYYFTLAKGSDPELLRRLRQALAATKADGTLARLRRQWISNLSEAADAPATAPR
ncbi:MAG: ABC transporter substrate-binding protein [Inhella sp.]